MDLKVSEELDYKKLKFIYPNYGFNKILPLGGIQTTSATTAGGANIDFELPQKTMNLYNSFVTFQFTVPAVGAPTANGYNNVFKDCMPHFQQILLTNRAGKELCNINDFANYCKIVFNAETELKDFMDNDYMTGVAGLANNANATPGLIGQGFHFHRSGVVKNSFTANAARPGIAGVFTNDSKLTFPAGAVVTGAGDIRIPINPSDVTLGNIVVTQAGATPASSNVDYTEPSYVYRSANEAGASESVLNMNVMFPLKYIYNSIFSINKDICFNEILVLRFVMNPSTKIAFINQTAGVAGSVVNLNTNASAILKTISYNNIALYLAYDKNPEIENDIKEKIAMNGYNILTPYVYNYKFQNTVATTSLNTSLRFSRLHGRSLLKIYHSIFHGTNSSVTAYDHNNINGAKCTSYYTMLNSNRLQDYDINCTNLDDYNLNRELLKDKVLQTANMFQYNWYHLDKFDGKRNHNSKDTNLMTGEDLLSEKKWDAFFTVVSGTYNMYTYAVTQKLITITESGVDIM